MKKEASFARFMRLSIAAAAITASACGAQAPTQEAPSPPAERRASAADDLFNASCVTMEPRSALAPSSRSRQGSTVALAKRANKLLALLADKDRKTLWVVDVDTQTLAESVRFEREPEQVLVLEDGRVVVSLVGGSELQILGAGQGEGLRPLCARATPAGPFGLAVSPDGASVVVTNGYAAQATVFRARDFAVQARVPLPRSPRGVLVLGETAYVTHLSGAKVSYFSLANPDAGAQTISTVQKTAANLGEVEDFLSPRTASQAYSLVSVELAVKDVARDGAPRAAGEGSRLKGTAVPSAPRPLPLPLPSPAAEVESKLVVPMVSVDPGTRLGRFENYYGPPPIAGVKKHAPTVATIDPTSNTHLSPTLVAAGPRAPLHPCQLPRASLFEPRSGHLFVACMGSDEVIELEGSRLDPMAATVRRFSVPQGPTGLALDEQSGLLAVFSQFDTGLTLIDLKSGAMHAVALELPASGLAPKVQLGREVFHRTNDGRITGDGIACASCHAEGGDDQVVWQTPEGPRQTISLAGRLRAGTAPYGWTRGDLGLSDYIKSTCSRLGGSGLPERELEALVAYAVSLPPPPLDAVDEAERAHGKAVFFARGCASCHQKGTSTDQHGHFFDSPSERELARDTPTLVRVSQTAPYYHDGRYATLEELLADPSNPMGETRLLGAEERRSLLVYLRSL